MANQDKCPACGEPILVPDESPGGKLRCDVCGAVLDMGLDGSVAVIELGLAGRRLPRRDQALEKVKGPGILLQIMGILWVLTAISLPALALFVKEQDRGPVIMFCLVCEVFLLPVGIITWLSGSRMKALRSWGLVLTSVILTFVMGILFCMPLALVGIWPLVVLLDANVKNCFDRPAG
jgi:hypothetical protein